MSYARLHELYPSDIQDFGNEINTQIELAFKYSGYIERQRADIERLEGIETLFIPLNFSYSELPGLKKEAKEKLERLRPETVGQASRILGVTAADIQILIIRLKRL